MNSSKRLLFANLLRNIARYALLILALFTFLFALLSGAEHYGGGFMGVLQNSPNALPWLILLGMVYIAWRWERIGGILIIIIGAFMVYFFNFDGHFYWSVLLLTVAIMLLGVCLVGSSYLRRTL
ncbi:MAG: hypothetical protein U0Y10_22630 [Spirosomataceae bacterium]